MAPHNEDSDQSAAGQKPVRGDGPGTSPVPLPSIIPCEDVSIQVDVPSLTSSAQSQPHRQPIRHLSAPAYQSPLRHRRRAPSRSKGVKETLNARSHYGSSDDDGVSVHRINQYSIKQEIGRGSFGAVHLAVDQYGNEFAVKEFSKSRLRKRAQSNLLRKPAYARRSGPAGMGFNSPLHRQSSSDKLKLEIDSLSLIKEEIAIMKKLDHHNVVSLIEVLDDPQEDSLYMVLEICKKGVVMKVSVEERAQPYGAEACRCWFRDMILGIEYLHAQGIIHRDIKPDNCLITHDDVLKIVDFGVSEMFEKESEMHTTKSAGSPAFMPPELCVAKHGPISGRAADIWSMGVTLYCLRYGRIPFEQTNMLELYDSIKSDSLTLEGEQDENFSDLMHKLLEKDPEKRITMDELRRHPWVTRNGADPLLPAEENCAALVTPPTEAEMNDAITGEMSHLMVVMKAVKRFKRLVRRKRPEIFDSILGRESRFSQPPHSLHSSSSRSVPTMDRQPVESALVVEGVHREIDRDISGPLQETRLNDDKSPSPQREVRKHEVSPSEDQPHSPPQFLRQKSSTFPLEYSAKGQAHDPLEDRLFLHIGSNPETTPEDDEYPHVSESPSGVDEDIYEAAYQEEMKRILESKGTADLVLTRRVEHIERLRRHPNVLSSSINHAIDFAGVAGRRIQARAATGGFANFVREARETAREKAKDRNESTSTPSSGEGRTPNADESLGVGGSPTDGPSTPGSVQNVERARKRDLARSQAGDVLKGVAKRLDDKANRLQARANSGSSVLTTGASGDSSTAASHDA